jgi:hypothetical protein
MVIQSVLLVLSTQLCELLPLSPSLWFQLSHHPPFPCVNKFTVNTYSVCTGGGGGYGLALYNTDTGKDGKDKMVGIYQYLRVIIDVELVQHFRL